jgi:uncharacterized membrane protein YraQ (UPF0718 family)
VVLLRGGFAFVTAVTVGMAIDRLARQGVTLVREEVPRDRLIVSAESLRHSALALAPGHHHHHDHDGPCDHDHGHSHGAVEPPARRTLLQRLQGIAEIAMGDFIDIAAFLVIGALLAAAISTSLPRATVESLASQRELSIVAMMGLAVVLSLCSEADAFVSANFGALSTGSKLAMIVLGPMLDVKLFIMYRWVFTSRMVFTMIPIILGMIFGLCYAYDWIEPLVLSIPKPTTGG